VNWLELRDALASRVPSAVRATRWLIRRICRFPWTVLAIEEHSSSCARNMIPACVPPPVPVHGLSPGPSLGFAGAAGLACPVVAGPSPIHRLMFEKEAVLSSETEARCPRWRTFCCSETYSSAPRMRRCPNRGCSRVADVCLGAQTRNRTAAPTIRVTNCGSPFNAAPPQKLNLSLKLPNSQQ
jgi:hypothetical protein